MTDLSAPLGQTDGGGAGAMLRAARQKQGLHVAALAASIKVAPAKLEALEAGRYDELPDATFARALAQSVCRALKIDPQPVLAQLPSTSPASLDRVDAGLNTPFRDRPGRIDPVEWAPWRQPALWLVGVLLLVAGAFVLLPGPWLPEAPGVAAETPAVLPAESSAAAPAASIATVPEAQPVAPASAVAEAAEVPAAAAASEPAAVPAVPVATAATRLRALQDSWVQVVDANGQILLSRLMPAGESVEVAGVRPLRVRIGNAAGTELQHRGQLVDLAPRTLNNVATIELP